jgi:hypothetical protein
VCDSAVGAAAGTLPLYVALNDADYIDTGFTFTHYEQPSAFSRTLRAEVRRV